MSSFPRRVGELTASWLRSVLPGSPTFDEIELEPVGQGRGMLGELVRVTLRGEAGDLPTTIIAKFSADREGPLLTAKRSKSHLRETSFFAQLAQSTPVRAPRCFGNWYDHDSAEFLLLLEDIDADLSIDQLVGLDPTRTELVIDQLAFLHNRWWNDESLRTHDWLQRIDDPGRRANLPALSKAGWPILQPLLDAQQSLRAAERNAGQRLPELVDRMLVSLGQRTSTLVHGDLRLDNLLFTHEGEVVLIDWQGMCLAPPAFDLAYLLSQSLSTETRREHSSRLLDRYCARMRESGCPATREELLGGFDESLWFGLAIGCAICVVSDPSEPRAATLATTMARRALDALNDHHMLDPSL